ncbi:MAG: glycerophosphodiester phosphodiesterase [Anaerolineales bacterium]|nr:glycerophosphodiester phosphodiesterase [Anaerolineales bacterium]MCB8950996.1 glycerophosphodiester phosphodiesterase [Ardenticatenales bacterium]
MRNLTAIQRFGRILLILIVLLSLAYLVARVLARSAPAHPWFTPRAGEHHPLVFAHQGGENLWPSNTMFAFDQAAALGVDVLDSDMHMTRDGVLVLMHDETVDRTTNGTGAIRDMTLAEIEQLDAGYNFSTDGGQTFPYRGQGLTVPTLEALFQAYPHMRFGIEIKQTDPTPTAQRFCALIRQYEMEDQVLVSSFRQENMDAFRATCPEVATSATEGEVRLFYVLFRLGLSDTITPPYYSFQVPERSGNIHILTPAFVAAAQRRGLTVQPWTINEVEDMRRILALAVDGINTDNPDRLLDLLK